MILRKELGLSCLLGCNYCTCEATTQEILQYKAQNVKEVNS